MLNLPALHDLTQFQRGALHADRPTCASLRLRSPLSMNRADDPRVGLGKGMLKRKETKKVATDCRKILRVRQKHILYQLMTFCCAYVCFVSLLKAIVTIQIL